MLKTMLKLRLNSTITKKIWDFEVEDAADSILFYHFPAFQLTEKMDDGQYEYTLFDDEQIVAVGVLQIGDYNNTKKEYKKDGQYKQYNG